MSHSSPQSQPLFKGEANSLICACNSVSELEVRTAIEINGASTVSEVSAQTKAGTCCGACQCRIRRVLNGLPAACGGACSRCDGCGFIAKLCTCEAA